MPDIHTTYEQKLLRKQAALLRKIKKYYSDSIIEIVFQATTFPFLGETFALSNFPLLQKIINQQISKMHKGIFTTIVNGVEDSWGLSNAKNDLIIDKRLAGRKPLKSVNQILYDPNLNALQRFIKRTEKGLNLSERVWNTLDPFKKELEQGLGLGISEGKPAAEMATEMKRYLNDPDKLFRRVRGEDGELALSTSARNYNPGQGVYRSSYKNALRLTRTETNIAYRSADYERWQNIPFVVGIEIRLSNNHPRYDICDPLAGKYPKDFKFTGWHPNCICHQVPIMLTDEEYSKYEDQLLGIGEFDGNSRMQVDSPPAAFNRYLKKNGEKIAGWKNKPYWVKDNKQYVSL